MGHIHAAGRVIAHPQHRQPGGAPRLGQVSGDHPLKTLLQFVRQLAAIETGGHGQGGRSTAHSLQR